MKHQMTKDKRQINSSNQNYKFKTQEALFGISEFG